MNRKLLFIFLAPLVWISGTPAQESAASIELSQEDNKTWAMFADHPWPDATLQTALGQVCGLPFDDSVTPQSGDALIVEANVKRLDQGRASLLSTTPVVVAPLRGNTVNAWTFSNIGSIHAALICLPTGIRQITKDAPQELAAVIAHELRGKGR